ncbi:MAG: hypothetical protein ACRC2B_05770 [Rubrivivax sp.]
MATRINNVALGLMTQLRIDDPQRFRIEPLLAGMAGEAVPLTLNRVQSLLQRAAADAAGLVDARAAEAGVLWQSAAGELLVRPAQLRLQMRDGLLGISLPIFCDQTGAAEVHITFAVGSPQRAAGLLATTEERPRGPAAVVDGWGDALVGLAWQAVLTLLEGLAAESGRDPDGTPLLPVALTVGANGLVVQVAARHAFDRVVVKG